MNFWGCYLVVFFIVRFYLLNSIVSGENIESILLYLSVFFYKYNFSYVHGKIIIGREERFFLM